jgi:hypothetical protein
MYCTSGFFDSSRDGYEHVMAPWITEIFVFLHNSTYKSVQADFGSFRQDSIFKILLETTRPPPSPDANMTRKRSPLISAVSELISIIRTAYRNHGESSSHSSSRTCRFCIGF